MDSIQINPSVHPNLPLRLSIPYILGYMSVDGLREYHPDLSQLKFLNSIPQGKLYLDLNHNIHNAVKRTTDENDEKIDLLLKFLLHHKDRIIFPKNDLTIITYRRTLISIMCSAFRTSQPIRVTASLYKNCIYLCSLETPQDLAQRKSRSKRELTYCAWGYKFEQYLLSDLPNTNPDTQRPVIENEEFSIFYFANIGHHKMLYGAQIDGMLATSGKVTKPPEINDVEANLNYLRENSYVELKTNKEIMHWKQEEQLKRHKMLRCWCQCYLAGLTGLLIGFRNDEGIIQRVQWFRTEDIPQYCKNKWDPETALNYLDNFLTYIKDTFEDYIKESFTQDYPGPITVQFDAQYNQVNITKDIDPSYILLPQWYLNAMEK